MSLLYLGHLTNTHRVYESYTQWGGLMASEFVFGEIKYGSHFTTLYGLNDRGFNIGWFIRIYKTDQQS